MDIKEERERSLKRLEKEYWEKFDEMIIVGKLMQDIKDAQRIEQINGSLIEEED